MDPVEPEGFLLAVHLAEGDDVGHTAAMLEPQRGDRARGRTARAPRVFEPDEPAGPRGFVEGFPPLGDQFGILPPEDWAGLIDDSSAEVVARALEEIKMRHPVHPPTFPQVYEIIMRHSRVQAAGPNDFERLCAFVVKNRSLTFNQQRGWIYRHNAEHVCTALEIPADGDAPGFIVRLADLPDDLHG